MSKNNKTISVSTVIEAVSSYCLEGNSDNNLVQFGKNYTSVVMTDEQFKKYFDSLVKFIFYKKFIHNFQI